MTVQQMKNLTFNKMSNHIFTFGESGAGKSSLLASLCEYVQLDRTIRLKKSIVAEDDEGYRFMIKYWLKPLRNNLFPVKSRNNDVYQINLGFKIIDNEINIPITFQEFAGEDLMLLEKSIGKDNEDDQQIKNVVTRFLEASSIIFLVTTPSTILEDDFTFEYVFEFIEKSGLNTPVALIINKCDTLKNKIDDVENYLAFQMPATSKCLQDHNKKSQTKVFFYSTGIPDESTAHGIEEKRYADFAPNILNWMFETLRK